MVFDDVGARVFPRGEGKTVSFSGNRVTFVYGEPGTAYSAVEWAAAPGTPPRLHCSTDEGFYILEGNFGFRVGDWTFEALVGTFIFVPRGVEHAFWNEGNTEARLLSTVSPPGFEGCYLEELAEGLAAAGDDAQAAARLRERLSKKYDIEVVGPPRQATS
jgi:quercetin dioxygenase-like cupin family protein